MWQKDITKYCNMRQNASQSVTGITKCDITGFCFVKKLFFNETSLTGGTLKRYSWMLKVEWLPGRQVREIIIAGTVVKTRNN